MCGMCGERLRFCERMNERLSSVNNCLMLCLIMNSTGMTCSFSNFTIMLCDHMKYNK